MVYWQPSSISFIFFIRNINNSPNLRTQEQQVCRMTGSKKKSKLTGMPLKSRKILQMYIITNEKINVRMSVQKL